MKIEAVTVCVNYSDFLEHSIRYNKSLFDKWVVVTDNKDIKTKELCDRSGVMCVQTDEFYRDGSTFAKYRGINEGLKHLDKDGWIVFMDGDILLSPLTRRVFERKELQKHKMYGIDRLNCKGYERFVQFEQSNPVIIDNWLLHGAGLEFGARIVHIYGDESENGRFTGWKPLGFFQMIHSSKLVEYPDHSPNASRGDLEFTKLWRMEDRELIPEIIGVHIYTEDYKGQNWGSRQSKPFTYETPQPFIKRLYDKTVIRLNRYKYWLHMFIIHVIRTLR